MNDVRDGRDEYLRIYGLRDIRLTTGALSSRHVFRLNPGRPFIKLPGNSLLPRPTPGAKKLSSR
jgi:hypothetical protein